jgi:hypothetical protein
LISLSFKTKIGILRPVILEKKALKKRYFSVEDSKNTALEIVMGGEGRIEGELSCFSN